MSRFDENDISTYDSEETGTKLPLGWVILTVSLIIFGIYYFVTYTPGISGWTQEQRYEQSIK